MTELSTEQTQSWLVWGAGLLGLGSIAAGLIENWAKIRAGTFTLTDLIPDSYKQLWNTISGTKPASEAPAPAAPTTPTASAPAVETPVTPRATAQRAR